MPVAVFLGAVLVASVVGSAVSFLSNSFAAKRERLEAAREERALNSRYSQIKAEWIGEAC